ncbi:MAG: hypothetical protein GF334_04295 [Candidatus Altiarchaeales archaeon]|nr:hypothetical protein [Candidatus Altiarchaeales archaeon]
MWAPSFLDRLLKETHNKELPTEHALSTLIVRTALSYDYYMNEDLKFPLEPKRFIDDILNLVLCEELELMPLHLGRYTQTFAEWRLEIGK